MNIDNIACNKLEDFVKTYGDGIKNITPIHQRIGNYGPNTFLVVYDETKKVEVTKSAEVKK